MFKNILLLIISATIGALLVIMGFLWISPRNTQVLKIILPQSFFSLEKAPSASLVGEIASFSGKVAWQSRIAPVAVLINHGLNKLQQGEEVDTYSDGNATINFPKVGAMAVLPNAQVNFIQTLPDNLVVLQKQGFVDYSKTGGVPVSIIALDLLVNIETGQCSVLVNKDAVEVTVTVKTGLVTVAFNDIENMVSTISIKAGKSYVFDNNTKTGVIKNL